MSRAIEGCSAGGAGIGARGGGMFVVDTGERGFGAFFTDDAELLCYVCQRV